MGATDGSHLPADCSSNQAADHAVEAGITSITATNELLRGFQQQFFAQLQQMSQAMRATRELAENMRGASAHHTPAHSSHTPPSAGASPALELPADLAGAANLHSGVQAQTDSRERTATWVQSAEATVADAENAAQGAFAFAPAQHGAHVVGATPSLGQTSSRMNDAAGDANAGRPVARRLFEDSHRHSAAAAQPAGCTRRTSPALSPAPSAAVTPRTSLFETVLREAAKQKAAAHALLASHSSGLRSGTPAWAARLSDPSAQASPSPEAAGPVALSADALPSACAHPPARTNAPPAGTGTSVHQAAVLAADRCAWPVSRPGSNRSSRRQDLADAASAQHELVGALQADFAATSEQVASAGLELEALRAELELLREQVRIFCRESAVTCFGAAACVGVQRAGMVQSRG